MQTGISKSSISASSTDDLLNISGIGQLVKKSTHHIWNTDCLVVGLVLALGLVFDGYEFACHNICCDCQFSKISQWRVDCVTSWLYSNISTAKILDRS